MLSEVRDYFKQIITTYDSSFKEWDDAFNSENIPSGSLNKAFFVEYQVDSSTFGNGYGTDTLSVTVKLFFKGTNKPQAALDNGMDTAFAIRNEAQNLESIALTETIADVKSVSIIPEPRESNDNIIIINLNFNVLKNFCF